MANKIDDYKKQFETINKSLTGNIEEDQKKIIELQQMQIELLMEILSAIQKTITNNNKRFNTIEKQMKEILGEPIQFSAGD